MEAAVLPLCPEVLPLLDTISEERAAAGDPSSGS